MTFEIRPYVGAGPIEFGMSEHEVAALCGSPPLSLQNRKGEREDHFQFFTVRYAATGSAVVEIAFVPGAVVLYESIDIFTDPKSLRKLISVDGAPLESLGFLLLLKLGLTLTGFHDNGPSQKAITVFERGRWDNLAGKFREFRLE